MDQNWSKYHARAETIGDPQRVAAHFTKSVLGSYRNIAVWMEIYDEVFFKSFGESSHDTLAYTFRDILKYEHVITPYQVRNKYCISPTDCETAVAALKHLRSLGYNPAAASYMSPKASDRINEVRANVAEIDNSKITDGQLTMLANMVRDLQVRQATTESKVDSLGDEIDTADGRHVKNFMEIDKQLSALFAAIKHLAVNKQTEPTAVQTTNDHNKRHATMPALKPFKAESDTAESSASAYADDYDSMDT
jgi:hypothetical protein